MGFETKEKIAMVDTATKYWIALVVI